MKRLFGRTNGLPIRVRRWLHRHIVARTGVRPWLLLLGVLGLKRALREQRDVEVVADRLSRGWGNPRYAAGPALIGAVIREASAADGAIIECGSGITTVVLAASQKHLGIRVVSLEHEADWATAVRRRLRMLRLPEDVVLHRPLAPRSDYEWYALDQEDLPPEIRLVVCDGPPESTPGGRIGVLEVIGSGHGPGVVVVDDVHRPAERDLCSKLESLGYEVDTAMASPPSERHAVLRATTVTTPDG